MASHSVPHSAPQLVTVGFVREMHAAMRWSAQESKAVAECQLERACEISDQIVEEVELAMLMLVLALALALCASHRASARLTKNSSAAFSSPSLFQ
jgi:hypothetical protein